MSHAPTTEADLVFDALLELPIEREVAHEHLERLAEFGWIERYGAGQRVFGQGEPAEEFRIISSGRVRLTLETPGGAPAVIAALSRGDILGWSALRRNDPPITWTATAHAVKATSCLAFPGRGLRSLCEVDHELGYHVVRHAFEVVARRLIDCRIQLLDIYCRD